MGINSNMNGADEYMIQRKTDIKMIFNEEHHYEVCKALQSRILVMLQINLTLLKYNVIQNSAQ